MEWRTEEPQQGARSLAGVCGVAGATAGTDPTRPQAVGVALTACAPSILCLHSCCLLHLYHVISVANQTRVAVGQQSAAMCPLQADPMQSR